MTSIARMIELDEAKKRKAPKAAAGDHRGRGSDVPNGAGARRVTPRVLNLPDELWARIDEYWHAKRLASRTAAIRVLLEEGLKG